LNYRFGSSTITNMDRDVKSRRTYDGAARQARTRRTRVAVVEAAQSLFVERGYAATTIDAISDRSDTPPTTVYRLFASKLGILKALLDVSIGGDDEAVAMADRPQVRALYSAEDPNGQLAAFAALLHQVMARVGPVHRILADAARSDQDGASPARWLVRAPCGPGSASATPPTSSTPWRPPRSTACSSPTGAGAASGTRTG
jgi:AcrR family transcriptional regulator